YHTANGKLPYGEGPGNPQDPITTRHGCCWGTWQMLLLPYLEQQAMFDAYRNLGGNDLTGMAMTGTSLRLRYGDQPDVVSKRLKVLTCPSDQPNAPISNTVNGVTFSITSHNYVVNYGNTNNYQVNITTPVTATFGGAPFGWAPYQPRLDDITDGASNTLM